MSDELLNNPDFREWAERTRSKLMPMIQESALVVSLVPETDADMKFAVELGLAIMLDKPIIAVVAPGQIIAGKLRQAADAIVEWDSGQPGGEQALMAEIERQRKRLGLE